MLLVVFTFLMSIFDVTRYDGSYLCCTYVSRAMKFTAFIYESVEKNKSISSKQVDFEIIS